MLLGDRLLIMWIFIIPLNDAIETALNTWRVFWGDKKSIWRLDCLFTEKWMSNNYLFFLKQLNVNILAHLRRRGKETCFKSFFFFFCIAQWSLQNNSRSLSEPQVNVGIKHKQCSHYHSPDEKKKTQGGKVTF